MKGKLAVFAVALLLAAAIASLAAEELVIQEFIGDPYPQLTDITDNPMQAGIKVIRDNERITLENKNKRFILVTRILLGEMCYNRAINN